MASGWRDHEDRPVERPEPPGHDAPPYWAAIGDFQAGEYRRNAFARATAAEVDALWSRLDLRPGVRILDVGCGNARHLVAAGERGASGVGIDASQGLVAAGEGLVAEAGLSGRIRLGCLDARDLAAQVEADSFDVAWSLSQGAVGTDPAGDATIVAAMAGAVRSGGQLVVTVFHALFAVRHLGPGDAFDPDRLVHHHVGEVRGDDDARRDFDLWTTTYTARGARRLCEDAGLVVEEVVGAAPGRYDGDDLGLDDPELMVVCRRPPAG